MRISGLTGASGKREPPFRGLVTLALSGSIVTGAWRAAAADAPAAAPTAATGSNAAQDQRVQARRLLLERAKQRYEAGRAGGEAARDQLEGALDALRLAYQIAPASWLLFNLAQVQSQLGACREAAQLYQRFLDSKPAPDARANAEQGLKLLGSCDE